jgi:Rad3-related DNA helicase
MRLACGDSAVFFSATLTPLPYYREVLGGDANSPLLDIPSPFDEKHLCVAVMDKISTRYMEREDTLRAVVRAILTCVKAKPGNYMIFCPSYHYMNLVHDLLHKALPALPTLLQKKEMTPKEREEFLSHFDAHAKTPLVGFCVMGGIYSEGIDLVGKRLIGAIVVGVGLPSLSNEREAIRVYFDEKSEEGNAYAYIYPGMNRVLQAAGRVIRTEDDRGVVLLIDDRFAEPTYRQLFPEHLRGLHFVGDGDSLTHLLRDFWKKD